MNLAVSIGDIIVVANSLAISIYSLLTFAPKWIVEEEIKNNRWKLIIMIIIYILVSLTTLFGNGGFGS